MDARQEIREFLTSRRAKLRAADVGLPDYGARRVPGLRREEVAVLAGVSVPYYARLERGDLAGTSDSVLDALARALRLDDAERAHLIDLARAVQPLAPPPRRRPAKDRMRPSVQQVLEAITGAAALLLNDRHDILAANALSRALFLELLDGNNHPNFARFIFLDPRARDFYLDWDSVARDVAAALRSIAGRKPYDRGLTDLVGELSTRSETFRQHWARHDVRFHHSGIKRLHHSQVGRHRAPLRGPPGRLRHRPDHLRLRRRPRYPIRRVARPARKPGRNRRPETEPSALTHGPLRGQATCPTHNARPLLPAAASGDDRKSAREASRCSG